MRRLVARRLSRYTHSVHSRSCGRSTGRISWVSGMGNWYLATKSKAHLARRSLTRARTLSCSCTSRLVGRCGSSRSCMATYSGVGRWRNWCGPSNSSRLDGRRCGRTPCLLGGLLLPRRGGGFVLATSKAKSSALGGAAMSSIRSDGENMPAPSQACAPVLVYDT